MKELIILNHRTPEFNENKAMTKFEELLNLNSEDFEFLMADNAAPNSIFEKSDIDPLMKAITFHDAYRIVKYFLKMERAKIHVQHELAELEFYESENVNCNNMM